MTKHLLARHARVASITLLLSALAGHSSIASAQKASAGWRPGIDYITLIPPMPPLDTVSGKIEVMEIFKYISDLSVDLQPTLLKWVEKNKDRVVFRRMPTIVYPVARDQARTYYTLVEMGREDLHQKFFEFCRDTNNRKVYYNAVHPRSEEILAGNLRFASANGLDTAKYRAIYSSKEMDDTIVNTEIQTDYYDGILAPAFVVAGKYATGLHRMARGRNPSAHDFGRMIQMLDYLVTLASSKNARQ